jgi:hypothetical protein
MSLIRHKPRIDTKYGQGTITYINGDEYIGGWKFDSRNGQGTFTSSYGRQKVGQWQRNKLNGYAKYTVYGFTYQEGIFKDDMLIEKK